MTKQHAGPPRERKKDWLSLPRSKRRAGDVCNARGFHQRVLGLYCSVPAATKNLARTLAFDYFCRRAFRKRFVERKPVVLRTDIKWPNDLLAGERKICGILAEVIDTEMGRAIVLGMGINVTSEAFPRNWQALPSPLKKRPDSDYEKSSILHFVEWIVSLVSVAARD